MKLIEPSYQIVQAPPYHDMLATIEAAARTCYKSEDKIKEGSGEKLIRSCIKKGHESVLEHCVVSVRIVCDRGVSHELVRHRLASYSQESQRYCAYQDEITCIRPEWFGVDNMFDDSDFLNAVETAEQRYITMLKRGNRTPQDARAVLPNATATTIVMTCNLREWRTVFRLRTAKAAAPEMRRIMRPMLADFADRWQVFFGDLLAEEGYD